MGDITTEELRVVATSLLDDNKKQRLKNVQKLRAFVVDKSNTFTATDYSLLWEALFYAMWSADTPVLQRKIGADFCQLIRYVPRDRIAIWVDSFCAVMRAEWFNLDRYRIDKMQLFVRMFVAECLNWLKGQSWNIEALDEINQCWVRGPFASEVGAPKSPQGLGYQVAEVFLEEFRAERVGAEIPEAVVMKLLDPFLTALCSTANSILVDKLVEKVFMRITNDDLPLELLAEALFEKAASGSRNLSAIYKCINRLDSELASLGRTANYQAILERVSKNPPTTEAAAVERSKGSKKVKKVLSKRELKEKRFRKKKTAERWKVTKQLKIKY